MRSLMTLIAGALLGAGVLFVVLSGMPTPNVPEADAAGGPAARIEGALPPAPVVEPVLDDASLVPGSEPAGREAPPATKPGTLLVPVQGVAASELTDTFYQPRAQQRQHEALDIMAPAGTPVRAVADGKVAKLFQSEPGGLTLYQFDPGEQYAYYYAHLQRYADNISEGMQVKRGQVIGYVGATGNADPAAPHLHFAVNALTPEKQWWKGTPLNPFPLMSDQ